MSQPNIALPAQIYGETVVSELTTTTTTQQLICQTNKVVKINTIMIANKTGTDATTTVTLYDSSLAISAHLAYQVNVPANSTLVLVSKDTPIYLEESDEIRAGAGTASALDCVISYEEVDDA